MDISAQKAHETHEMRASVHFWGGGGQKVSVVKRAAVGPIE